MSKVRDTYEDYGNRTACLWSSWEISAHTIGIWSELSALSWKELLHVFMGLEVVQTHEAVNVNIWHRLTLESREAAWK
jgi:hypothetical protein